MRGLNLANDRKRDAVVGLDAIPKKPAIRYVLKDGRERRNVKILKSMLPLDITQLVKTYGSAESVSQALIDSDPEVDIEQIGRIITRTHKLFLKQDNTIAYRATLVEVLKNPDGTERERRDLSKTTSNVHTDVPIQWSGKKFAKDAAVRKFIFSRKYQIKHVSGLTYDFLYEMAKDLHNSNSLMFIGGGKKGSEPIVLTTGGDPYRGFLEGRIDGDKYCLILHLSNTELKGVPTHATE
jgi:hypothetical protein